MGKLLLIAACLMLACGCRPPAQDRAHAAEIATFHQGSLAMPANKDVPRLIYVDTGANMRAAPHLAQHLSRALAKSQFRPTDSPSKAGYILHVNVISEGRVAPDELRSAVNAGYGKSARFSGQGATGVLVDALMVQRRVPEHKRPSRQRMKNISSRNALGSSQMRLGAISSATGAQYEAFSEALARELATALK